MSDFIKFPKIKDYATATREMRNDGVAFIHDMFILPKMHGTNAAVRITPEGLVIPQSRNRILPEDAPHFGFREFTQHPENIDYFQDLAKQVRRKESQDVMLYGEWVGPGIQKKVALNDLSRKYFVIFGCLIEGIWSPLPRVRTEGQIRSIADFPYEAHIFDLRSGESQERLVKRCIELRDTYEEECPVARGLEGIEGIGEGVTVICFGPEKYAKYWFKVKGAKHQRGGKPQKDMKVSALGAETPTVIKEFFNENRLLQGLEYLDEMGHPRGMRSTKHFLEWCVEEYKTEGPNDLDEQPKEYNKQLSHYLVSWYKINKYEGEEAYVG